MQNAKIDYIALNCALAHFKLPGDIETSDFQRYYIMEAAKAYMGLPSDFNNFKNKSKSRSMSEVVPILKEFNILKDEDPFYDLFMKFTRVRSKLGDDVLFYDQNFKKSVELVQHANDLLDDALKDYKNSKNEKNLGADAKAEILRIIGESGLSTEEVLQQLKD